MFLLTQLGKSHVFVEEEEEMIIELLLKENCGGDESALNLFKDRSKNKFVNNCT